jgi:hypothetical protein
VADLQIGSSWVYPTSATRQRTGPSHNPQKHFLVLHSLPQKYTANLRETSCQLAPSSLQCPQIEPGSLKNFAAQLKEGARTARFQRPRFFPPNFFARRRSLPPNEIGVIPNGVRVVRNSSESWVYPEQTPQPATSISANRRLLVRKNKLVPVSAPATSKPLLASIQASSTQRNHLRGALMRAHKPKGDSCLS